MISMRPMIFREGWVSLSVVEYPTAGLEAGVLLDVDAVLPVVVVGPADR
jgi:hypothetical protein